MKESKGFLWLAGAVAVGVAASGLLLWGFNKLMGMMSSKTAA